MKWTDPNGTTFEGTVEEYMLINGQRRRKFSHRKGLDYTVFDLAGHGHSFIRQKDAAAFIAAQLNRKFSQTKLSSMKTRVINLCDLIPDSELALITRPDSATQTPNTEIA